MDAVREPSSPGAGRPPAALVGRERQRVAWRVALDRTERGRTAQPLVLYGLRGVGKTVLLSEFTHTAGRRDWIVAQVEAGAGKSLRQLLGEALHPCLMDLARPDASRRLLKDLSESAQEDGTGLAILIDEAQDLSPEELTAVCATAHLAGQRGLPLMFALAGLPNLPRVLAEAKSYAVRLFAFERIDQLPDDLALPDATTGAATYPR